MSFFPDLVWTLRDFFLGLEVNGQAITSDEYLEKSLMLKQGNRASVWGKGSNVLRYIFYNAAKYIIFHIYPLNTSTK